MRRRPRTDANQDQIVRELRARGCSVWPVNQRCDLVVGWRGTNHLFEVKDPEKSPSARRLTEAEQRFHDDWKGQVDVIHTADEAFEIMGKHRMKLTRQTPRKRASSGCERDEIIERAIPWEEM